MPLIPWLVGGAVGFVGGFFTGGGLKTVATVGAAAGAIYLLKDK